MPENHIKSYSERLTPLAPSLSPAVDVQENMNIKREPRLSSYIPSPSSIFDNMELKGDRSFAGMSPREYIRARYGEGSDQMRSFDSSEYNLNIQNGIVMGQYIDANGEPHIMVNCPKTFHRNDKKQREIRDINLNQVLLHEEKKHYDSTSDFYHRNNGRYRYIQHMAVLNNGKHPREVDEEDYIEDAQKHVNTDDMNNVIAHNTSGEHNSGYDPYSLLSNHIGTSFAGRYKADEFGRIVDNQTGLDSLTGHKGDYEEWRWPIVKDYNTPLQSIPAAEAFRSGRYYDPNDPYNEEGLPSKMTGEEYVRNVLKVPERIPYALSNSLARGGSIRVPKHLRDAYGRKLVRVPGWGDDDTDVYF